MVQWRARVSYHRPLSVLGTGPRLLLKMSFGIRPLSLPGLHLPLSYFPFSHAVFNQLLGAGWKGLLFFLDPDILKREWTIKLSTYNEIKSYIEKCFSYYKELFQVEKEMQIISHLILQVYHSYSDIIPSLLIKKKYCKEIAEERFMPRSKSHAFTIQQLS